jgi:hypothetical protein
VGGKNVIKIQNRDRQKTKKSAMSSISNKVSGANRPVAKVKPTKENIAKAAATQKAKEKITAK